jgi:oxepin-CoA hydrolase/3-oxo-5,6-dehydrosuberyl-CoA semialdehyde dehydrogenase
MSNMRSLESHIGGRWQSPSESGAPFHDASTGEQLGTISSAGIDLGEAVVHGRSVGNPALRALTIHERASILRDVGKLLLSEPVKDELYALSLCTGATVADSAIDIDGGASVLLTYSSKARKELPNGHVIVDGPTETLSRDGSFAATHILTPRRGVFLQINAFNFPVWGMLEKFAPAFIAGVPSIVKPASQTAYLTEAAVRIILDSGLLPPGALQLICGSAGDVLDHLDGQDSVGFTGSAATARLLRAHPNIVERSVSFTAEADSLNSAILAPSSTPETPEFGLFINEVVNEMTTKAGQKCTAIRRAFVPSQLLDDAQEALSEALSKVVVGDPRNDDVTMGPVASIDQATEVGAAIRQLQADTTVVSTGDGAEGTMLLPTLLRATDPRSSAIHNTEAFGPVSTLIGYSDIPEAIDLVAMGDGSLVASIHGADSAEIQELVLGIASHHGRVLVVDETSAPSSTGHGSPLPHLVHGGPGRAGGGEEMGGIRGVHHHMQRTAIQGSPAMLSTITGEYVTGAPTHSDKGHPFRLNFDDLEIGDSLTSESRVVTDADIAHFAEFTGDTFYAHLDEEAAARSPIFGGIVAHGYLVLSFAAGLFVDPPEGPVLANYGIDRLRFATPTRPGDAIHVVLTCKRKTQLNGRGYGEVAWDTQVINQNGEVAAVYDVLTMVANRPGLNGAPE